MGAPSFIDLNQTTYDLIYAASGYGSVKRSVSLSVPTDSCPEAAPPIKWLDAVSLSPSFFLPATLRGRIYSVRPEFAYVFSQPQYEEAVSVSLCGRRDLNPARI